jgi:drug/metabolite transporter (DMT)-like permease
MLAIVVAAWGLTWPVNKVLVDGLSPLWVAALRSAIATVAAFAILVARRRVAVPMRADVPVVLSITLLHMVGFVVLSYVGLALVSTGRAVVLAYTTPLWVTPVARIVLNERLTARRALGAAIGIAGLAVLFNPLAFDWRDHRAVVGNLAILAAAVLWAINIVHIRAHRWRATPLELLPWEILLATVILVPMALVADPPPSPAWTVRLVGLLLFSAVVGVALAYWALAVASRHLPAITVSLGLLATPVVSIVVATLWLGETVTLSLAVAMLLVLGGIALGTTRPFGASGSVS